MRILWVVFFFFLKLSYLFYHMRVWTSSTQASDSKCSCLYAAVVYSHRPPHSLFLGSAPSFPRWLVKFFNGGAITIRLNSNKCRTSPSRRFQTLWKLLLLSFPTDSISTYSFFNGAICSTPFCRGGMCFTLVPPPPTPPLPGPVAVAIAP